MSQIHQGSYEMCGSLVAAVFLNLPFFFSLEKLSSKTRNQGRVETFVPKFKGCWN